MVKNLPANSGYVGSMPGLGKIPILGATKPVCTTAEPVLSNEPTMKAHALQLERLCCSNEDPTQQKKRKILIPCVAYVKFLLGSIDLEHVE